MEAPNQPPANNANSRYTGTLLAPSAEPDPVEASTVDTKPMPIVVYEHYSASVPSAVTS